MVMSELFSELDKLGRAEKLRIVQHLVNDLAAEGEGSLRNNLYRWPTKFPAGMLVSGVQPYRLFRNRP